MKSYASRIVLTLSVTACTSARLERSVPASRKLGSPEPNGAKAAVVPAAPGRWDTQRGQGVDFVGTGTEPFWALEIGPQRGMRFKSIGSVDSLHTPVPPPSQAQDAPVTRYRAVTEAGELVVTIAQRACTNAMSGEVMPYTVTVRAKTTTMREPREFTGCGIYLGDYRLHDIWVLDSLNGQVVPTGQFSKQQPYVEINLTTQRLLGFAGCNQFSGPITPERAGIRFGLLQSTNVSCPALAFEQKFLAILSGCTFGYRLANRRLTLKNRVDTAVFKKVD